MDADVSELYGFSLTYIHAGTLTIGLRLLVDLFEEADALRDGEHLCFDDGEGFEVEAVGEAHVQEEADSVGHHWQVGDLVALGLDHDDQEDDDCNNDDDFSHDPHARKHPHLVAAEHDVQPVHLLEPPLDLLKFPIFE